MNICPLSQTLTYLIMGLKTAQTVSRRLLTVEASVRAQVSVVFEVGEVALR
jgi:hypothetical protein